MSEGKPAEATAQEWRTSMSLKRLFVGNLSKYTSEQELREAFAEHGRVLSVTLVVDEATGRPRGFGFVEYETDAGAEGGLLALNGSMLHGHMLFVNVARDPGPADSTDQDAT